MTDCSFGFRLQYGSRALDAGRSLTSYGLVSNLQIEGGPLLSGTVGYQRGDGEFCIESSCDTNRLMAGIRYSNYLVTTRPFLRVPFFTENDATGTATLEFGAGWADAAFGERQHWTADITVPLSLAVGQSIRVVPFATPSFAVAWGTTGREWSRGQRFLVGGGVTVQEIGRFVGLTGLDVTAALQRAFSPHGTLVAFLASQAWGDVERANAAVNREASSLRAAVLLSEALPADAAGQLRDLIRQHIQQVERQEWPAMARREVTLAMIPMALAQALRVTFGAPVEGAGQVAAQREIVSALENALDARRQRILVSETQVNGVKWTALLLQAVCMLVGVAMVHSDSRATARIALGLFSTAIAVSIVLILANDRPFVGPTAVKPTPLLQVLPKPGSPTASAESESLNTDCLRQADQPEREGTAAGAVPPGASRLALGEVLSSMRCTASTGSALAMSAA